ncbi:MAG: Vi polysaccharide biosynthesis UDP-N-acetylglucosamine C-6 dehydrogenase TviB [Xanthomonadales bacterium]|nr:Vi polysaccharide biosynthesis UDP-N-acetylglucosamine C-6 dehydrogenase TviB [Xanthomonadales bacterium]
MDELPKTDGDKIAIIGLGYVGLPLAVEFGKYFATKGFDVNQNRISELMDGTDSTLEVSDEELAASAGLTFTTNPEDLADCTVFVVTVPTPIDQNNQPDLSPLKVASSTVGGVMKSGAVVVYESTVYPGTTEDTCVPILEQQSGLKYNVDFFVGYSPERINPGDQKHRLPDIVKVTSGSTPETAEIVDALYQTIIRAGTHKASSIRVAEAAKVIENTQRDLNIALINELAVIFARLGIDTVEVLEAAGTKWNFLPFRPGLVGGHCIGVDPYYLTHKALQVGYHPEVILAGRRLNDNMGVHIAGRVVKLMTQKRIHVVNSRVLVLGLTFKENCPDMRNTRVIDVVNELNAYHAQVDVFDPWVKSSDARENLGMETVDQLEEGVYDAIILAVAHDQFREMGIENIRRLGRDQHVLFDVKAVFERGLVDDRL